jgi:hypothetical protein
MTKKECFAILKEFGSLENYSYKNGITGNGLYLKTKKTDTINKFISLGINTKSATLQSNPYGMINLTNIDDLIFNSSYYKYRSYQVLDKKINFWFMLPNDQINNFRIHVPTLADYLNFLEQKKDLFLNTLIPTLTSINSIEDFYEFSEPLKYRAIQDVYRTSDPEGNQEEQWIRLFVKAYVKAPDFMEHLEFFKNKKIAYYQMKLPEEYAAQSIEYIPQLITDLIDLYNNTHNKIRTVSYCKGEYDITPLDEIEELNGKIQKERNVIDTHRMHLDDLMKRGEDGPDVPDWFRKETSIKSRERNIKLSEENIEKFNIRIMQLKEKL